MHNKAPNTGQVSFFEEPKPEQPHVIDYDFTRTTIHIAAEIAHAKQEEDVIDGLDKQQFNSASVGFEPRPHVPPTPQSSPSVQPKSGNRGVRGSSQNKSRLSGRAGTVGDTNGIRSAEFEKRKKESE